MEEKKYIVSLIGIICRKIGNIIGVFSLCISPNFIRCWNEILDSYHTTRLRKRFKHFGVKSILRRGVEVKNPQNISINNYTIFEKKCIIESWHFSYMNKSGDIYIGNNCSFGEYTHITATNKIEIGDNLLTGRFVLITDNSHGITNGLDIGISPIDREVTSKGPTKIGKNVWLADKVAIMPGVTIGDDAIIAANAVVTHDIPPFCVAAGIPARVVKIMKAVKS